MCFKLFSVNCVLILKQTSAAGLYNEVEKWSAKFSAKLRRVDDYIDDSKKSALFSYSYRYTLLTAIGLTPGGSLRYTFTNKQYTKQHHETEYKTVKENEKKADHS
jgi:hypothetical protein